MDGAVTVQTKAHRKVNGEIYRSQIKTVILCLILVLLSRQPLEFTSTSIHHDVSGR
jgi:hypothetical protein